MSTLVERLLDRAEYHKRVAGHDPTFAASDRCTETLLREAAHALMDDWGLDPYTSAEIASVGVTHAAALPLPAPAPASPWRDMETAPKDTKVLVAYQNALGNWRVVLACYHTQLPWSEESYLDFVDQEGEYAPEGWYEESETHETILPVDGTPLVWCEIPTPSAKDT